MAEDTPSTLQPIPQADITDPAPELPVWSNIDHLKQQPRYRNSISTESPIVMLTPPNPDEVVREERRLSNASAHSITSASANNDSNAEDSHQNDNHLVPPAEPEPEEVVAKLISQRRASTITTLSHVIKQIFIEKKVKEDGIPSEIVKGVYLGSIGAAKNLEWLKKNNVTHILCVAGGIGECFPKQFTYKVIDILDAPNEDISAHFKSSYDFIEDALKNNGKVLVHCFAGCSRSVTVVSAYLMQKRRMYAVPALKFVKQRRVQANPNAGFIVQLIKFQKVIGLKQRKNELDIPSASDNESQTEDEEEEKAAKPKKKTLKGLAFRLRNKKKMEEVRKALDKERMDNDNKEEENDNTNHKKDDDYSHNDSDNNNNQQEDDTHKSLTIRLNSPMVKEWENGRRPSLFTALAKLRGMKNRSRQGSIDSVHSNISAMSGADNLESTTITAMTRKTSASSPNTLQPMSAINVNLHATHLNINNSDSYNNIVGNNRKPSSPVSPLDPGHKLDLFPLRESNDENDDDEHKDDKIILKQPSISLSGLSRNVGGNTSVTSYKMSIDEEDAITPLEDLNNDPFPDINSDENKDNGPKAIQQSTTTLSTTEL